MVKTPLIKIQGQTLDIPNERAEEMPITVSYSQARAIAKSLRAPMSERQKTHVENLVSKNRDRWSKQKEAKELKLMEEESKKADVNTRIVVMPKRIYRNNKKMFPPKVPDVIEDDNDEGYEEEQEEEEIVQKPKKKLVKKIVREESDEDDDIIQKTTKKATQIVETVNKLDKAIEQMKTQNNRYDTLLSKIKF